MKTITLCILVLLPYLSSAQPYSAAMDSLAKSYMEKLPPAEKKVFYKMIKNRDSLHVKSRVDTSCHDYIFILESYCLADSSIGVTELYFSSDSDKTYYYYVLLKGSKEIPREAYFNGKSYDFRHVYYATAIAGISFYDLYEDYYTLSNLRQVCDHLRPVQELSYDSTLAQSSPADTSMEKRKELESIASKKLESTYQVITMIDRANKKTTVSLQLPVKTAGIRVRFVEIRTYSW